MTTQVKAQAFIANIDTQLNELHTFLHDSQISFIDAQRDYNSGLTSAKAKVDQLAQEREAAKNRANELNSTRNWVKTAILDVIERGFEPQPYHQRFLDQVIARDSK